MPAAKPPNTPIRFGIFEVDVGAREVRKRGVKVKLQQQPFEVLMLLLQNPAEIVTRDMFQKKLWPADTFVDFDRGLNKAINRIREALEDAAENPRFIQTIPKRGYRFIAPIDADFEPSPPAKTPTREKLAWGLALLLLTTSILL